MDKQQLLAIFQKADDAWSDELTFQFGKKAGDMRYTNAGQGLPGTRLAFLYSERTKAQEAWHAVATTYP